VSTRQRRNSRLYRFLFPAFCTLLSFYFLHHANAGRYGLESQQQMVKKSAQLEKRLATLKLKREELASRVRLLQDGNIERDMLDEQVRYQLNLLHKDEIVLMRQSG
jgi:cell division protein FtsB